MARKKKTTKKKLPAKVAAEAFRQRVEIFTENNQEPRYGYWNGFYGKACLVTLDGMSPTSKGIAFPLERVTFVSRTWADLGLQDPGAPEGKKK